MLGFISTYCIALVQAERGGRKGVADLQIKAEHTTAYLESTWHFRF